MFVFRLPIVVFLAFCLRGLLIHITHKHTREENEPHLENRISSHRLLASQRSGVSMPICGGIGDTPHTTLESSGVSVIMRIRESAGEMLAAPMSDRLHAPQFCMLKRVGGRRNGELPQGPKGPFAFRQRNPHRSSTGPWQTIKGVISQA